MRFDPFDLTVVEIWHGGTKQLDAKPLVIGEFTNTGASSTTPTEIGRSRLLEAYSKENEKRRRNAVGIISFSSGGGGGDV